MRFNHSVLCVSKNVNVQLYEGLVEVLKTIGELPANVILICPPLEHEHLKELMSLGMEVNCISSRWQRFRIPATVILLLATLRMHFLYKPLLFLGCDALGNIIAAVVARLTSTPYLHYSLELPPKKTQSMSFLHKLEHWSCRQADLLVTMDQPHADFICLETRALPERICLAPNTLRGPSKYLPLNVMKNDLGLDASSIIILHAGGIGAAQASIPLAESTRTWRNEWHLVFHSHCNMSRETYYQNFSNVIKANPRIHLNSKSVSSEKLDELVSNADVGLAWYDRELLGYRADFLGLAAGKIGRYLRSGVPVVVRDLPTIRTYIERYHCGICVSREDDIGEAIETILGDHENFSQGALRCYEEIWRPDKHLAEIQERVRSLIAWHTR